MVLILISVHLFWKLRNGLCNMSCGNGAFKIDTCLYNGFYRGRVASTADPQQTGRIRVRVFGIFDDDNIPVSAIPWAVPATSMVTGSGSGFGYWAVPDVDTHVFVFFEQGDVYQPVYFAEAPTGAHGQPIERITNYPYRKILKTKSGIVVYIDDKDKVVRLTHPSGKHIQMNGSGDVTIDAADVTIQASGEINVNASGNITVSGAQIDLNP